MDRRGAAHQVARLARVVDRKNLGEQAEEEFANYVTPDDGRKFPELYGVQRLTSNVIGDSKKIVITTIQRLYAMLKGEAELPPEVEEGSQFDLAGHESAEPTPVAYNPAILPEFFDVIFIDECHRSIYSLWRLTQIRDHVARSLELELDDFDYTPFVEKGGLGGARKVFGGELGTLIRELNEVLAV